MDRTKPQPPATQGVAPPRRRWGLTLAVLALLALLALLARGLGRDPHILPSALIGKPWPSLARPALQPPHAPLDWSGPAPPRVINLWASWCEACLDEHPALMQLSDTLRRRGQEARLLGLNLKDEPQAARAWLQRHGNPYAQVLADADGRLAIELGVYGAPETFVVDAQGRIAWKHVGPLTSELIQREVLPRLDLKP